MLGNYHRAQLNARRVTADAHVYALTRGDLHSDPIYLPRPSARSDRQSPLSLALASPSQAPVLIANYYITGVDSTNSSTSSSYDIYLYLPNDYNSDNDLFSILRHQIKKMETTGYLASLAGLESIKITVDTNTAPTPVIDDEPIHISTHILLEVIAQYSGKFTVTLPSTSLRHMVSFFSPTGRPNGRPPSPKPASRRTSQPTSETTSINKSPPSSEPTLPRQNPHETHATSTARPL
jgi:hypothetical protein